MRAPAFIFTLKFRIVALAMAAGLGGALITAQLMLRATQQNLEQVLLADARADRERTAALMAGKLEAVKQALLATARLADESQWRDAATMQQFLHQAAALQSMCHGLIAADANGRTLAGLTSGEPMATLPTIAQRSYFLQALHSDQPVVSEPLLSATSHLPLVVIAVAAMGRDGKPLGVLAAGLHLQSNTLFTTSNHRTMDARAVDVVFDRNGTLLAHSDPARVLGRAADEPGLREFYEAWRASGAAIDLDASAIVVGEHLVSMAGIPLSDWMHARIALAAVALQPVQAARRAAWAAVAAAGLLVALVAGGLAWMLVMPIEALRRRAQALVSGADSGTGGWPARRDEVGATANAFKELLAQLQQRQTEAADLLIRFEAVLDHAEIGIALSRNGHYVVVSRHFCQMFRYQPAQVVGQPTHIVHASQADYDALSERARPAFMANGAFEGEVQLVRSDGSAFWSRMRGRAVLPGDRSRGTIWVIEDITQARLQRERLAWAAHHDGLTSLANRASFETLLESATVAAASRPFSALFIDLDRFKQVNDTGGHAAGDALLREIAGLLARTLRQTDTVARLGGDEFAVLLPGCPARRAQEIAEKLRHEVEQYRLPWEGRVHQVGASIGVVVGDGRHATAAEVLRDADTACYAAKRGGRNRVEVSVAEVV